MCGKTKKIKHEFASTRLPERESLINSDNEVYEDAESDWKWSNEWAKMLVLIRLLFTICCHTSAFQINSSPNVLAACMWFYEHEGLAIYLSS